MESFSHFWRPLPKSWPSVERLRSAIKESPHFHTWARQEIPGKSLSDERAVENLVHRVVTNIQCWWIEDNASRFLDIDNLGALRDSALEDEEGYDSPSKFYTHYYGTVANKVLNSILGKVLSEQELEMAVPHIDSPYYRRNRVILSYLTQMNNLKDRGPE